MKTDTIGRAVALGAGVISAVGGLALLLDDVVKGTVPFDVKHGITIGIVALAILAGHSVTNAARARSVFGVAGFLIVFLAATGLVVIKSTGRQAEHTFASQAEADFAAEERARIRPLLAEAEAMLSGAAKAIQTQCVEGRASKKQCDGLRATHGVYTAAVTGHKAELARLGPPKPVAPEAENFAELAAVFGADRAKVKAATLLSVPFLTTALFEFGAIVGFYFAFRHRRQPSWQPSATETAQTSFSHPMLLATQALPRDVLPFRKPGNRDGGGDSGNRPSNPKPPVDDGNRRTPRVSFEADVLTRLALGQSIESQDTLAEHHRVHKGVVSKWLKDMRRRGLIPAAQRVGRCHRLVAAD